MKTQPQIQNYLLARAQRLFTALRQAENAPTMGTVHQVRVTSRRLRVGLKLFGVALPTGELRQITRRFGDVRALDVNLQLLGRAGRNRPVRQWLSAQRRAAVRALPTWETDRLERRVRALINECGRKFPVEDAQQALNDRQQEVSRRFRVYRRRGGRRAFHRLRIAAKRYRYALETVETVLAAPVRDRIQAVRSVQDLMGACHDVEVLLEALAAADKTLAKVPAKTVEFFQNEHDRRLAEFEKFIQHDRQWLKKVRLKLQHE
jgi:CHAD domain-containing protein